MSQTRILGRARTHTLPFVDHTDQRSYMVFESTHSLPLPHLYGYSFYLTHPSISPATFESQGASFLRTVSKSHYSDPWYRLDVHFIPNATPETCMAHYRAEKQARGDYMRQVRTFDRLEAEGRLTPEVGRKESGKTMLPGIPASHLVWGEEKYHNVLWIVTAEDWEAEEAFTRVEFDPGPVEKRAGGGNLPDVRFSKAWLDRLPVVNAPETILGEHLHAVSHVRVNEETGGTWQGGEELGWDAWPRGEDADAESRDGK